MARWTQNGVSVAGDHAAGDARNQLSYPEGLYVDENYNTVFVADSEDNRIIEWKLDERSGQVLIGGDVQGNQPHRLNFPVGVIVDKANDSLIIDDRGNRRAIRCSRSNGTGRGETIIEDIDCSGLAMDDEGSLYISDVVNHEVSRYRKGETRGVVVAGGNGQGAGPHQLHEPYYVCVDADHAVHVSDLQNHRVMKWMKDAKEGIGVAGGRGGGSDLAQLFDPNAVLVDATGTVYVADIGNDRVMLWGREAARRTVVVKGNGEGDGINQFHGPSGLSFDRHGNLYVADFENHRVQRFAIEKN